MYFYGYDRRVYLIRPLSYFTVSGAIAMTALNFRPRNRIYFLPAISLFAYYAYIDYAKFSWSDEYNSLWAIGVLVWFVHITYILYVEQVILPKTASGWNIKAAYKMWYNLRSFAIDPTLPDLRRDSQAQNQHKTRTRFLIEQLVILAAAYAIDKACKKYIFPDPFMLFSFDDFAPGQETYFRRLLLSPSSITIRDTLLRGAIATYWIWGAYIMMVTQHTTVAILWVVVVQVDEPQEWPSLFGSIKETYTLRWFWSKFWHRVVVHSYTGYAAFISRKVLRLKSGSTADKLFKNGNVFLYSGIVHSLVSIRMGFECANWTDVGWFVLNFVAIVIEQALLASTRKPVSRAFRSIGLDEQRDFKKIGMIKRAIGHLWVFTFFFWSVPKWLYPKTYCGRSLESMLDAF